MKKGLLFLTCATSTLLYGDGWFMLREHPHRIEESIEEPPAEEGITGIALIGKADLIQPGGYERLSGIRAFGLDIPGGILSLRQHLEPEFLGKPITKETLVELKHALILYFRERGRPLVTVQIPEQEISNRTIQVLIVEGRLGKVIARGNRWFSKSYLRKRIEIDQGSPIEIETLLDDVAWINRNPFLHTDVLFAPGEKDGETDIELITKDRFPARLYVGGDNTGNEATGMTRWFTGLNWGNVFGTGHQFTYQWTTSSNLTDFMAHTGNYIAPLPWGHHTFTAFGGYAHFHAHFAGVHSDFGHFSGSGQSWQVSGRYAIPLGSLYKGILRNFTFGFDFKNTNNTFAFVDGNTPPIISKPVNIGQFMGGFDFAQETKRHKWIFDLETYWSPCPLFDDQSKARFEALRPGANVHYFYGKLALSDLWKTGCGVAFFQEYRFQMATKALLPSEQLGIGGYNTVRGYEERQFNADNGLIANGEIHMPKFSLGGLFRKRDALCFLAFIDYGFGRNYSVQPEQRKTEWLLGVGPGLRYTVSTHFTARVDWGFKLHKTEYNLGGMGRLHVGAVLSF